MTIAASTMAPSAIAMPPRLMMLEPMPSACMQREGDQHADRQHEDGDQRAARMQQEQHADRGDDQAFLDQRALERVDARGRSAPSGHRPAAIDTPSGRPAAVAAIFCLTLPIVGERVRRRRA